MFGRQIEEEFVNTHGAFADNSSDSASWRLLTVLTIVLGAAGVWASVFNIEEVTRGQGRVVPSSQLQVVQSFEGGIVQSIDVQEGDRVEVGQVLVQIDDTSFMSQLSELEERQEALLAERVRLRAEANQQDEIAFPGDLVERNQLATAVETEVFLSRREQYVREVSVLNNKLLQRESELGEMKALQEKRRGMVVPLRQEHDLVMQMATRNAVPKIEMLRVSSRLAELEGDLAVGDAAMRRVQASIEQAKSEIRAAESSYVLTARQRLAKLQVELAVVQETLKFAGERVARTSLRSPVRGTVNMLTVATLGAVVQPGAPIAEIVPVDDGLVIEAKIKPSDVAFIKPGDTVYVKITAYDYLIYGRLQGTLTRIGADTTQDKEGNEFFRVTVRTESNFLGTEESPLPILPGMVATIEVQTGQKTVMDYILKPIRRANAEALRER